MHFRVIHPVRSSKWPISKRFPQASICHSIDQSHVLLLTYLNFLNNWSCS
jgi:hypothetical protein